MLNYDYVIDAQDLPAIARDIERNTHVGFDIETTSLSPRDGDIRLLSIKTEEGWYLIDLFQTDTIGPVLDALTNPKVILVLQNARFESSWFLYKYGVELWPIFDTYRASAIIYNGKRGLKHDLGSIIERELDDPSHKGQGASDWSQPVLTQEQLDYAAKDSEVLLRLRKELVEKIYKWGLEHTARLEFGVVLPEAAIELNGLYLDGDRWMSLYNQNKQAADALRNRLKMMLPDPSDQLTFGGIESDFNVDSPAQVLGSLQKLEIFSTITERSDITGRNVKKKVLIPDTNNITLAMLADEHDVINYLMEYRGLSKKVTSFGGDYLKHINPNTGRIHPYYYPFTGAGRYSCIPIDSPVVTDRGIIPIGDVVEGDKVQTPDGPRDVLSAWRTGIKPILRFALENNQWLECTAEHIVYCNGEWVRAEDIEVGDDLYISGVPGPDVEDLVDLSKLMGFNVTKNTGGDSSFLDERLAFLLGRYLFFGVVDLCEVCVRGKYVTVPVDLSESEAEVLEKLFKVMEWSDLIPEVIFKSPNHVRDAFVRACFDEQRTAVTDDRRLAHWLVTLVAAQGLHLSLKETRLRSGTILYTIDRFVRGASMPNFTIRGVTSINVLPSREVCDIEVEGNHCFLINGVLVKNSSKPNLQQVPRTADFRSCFRAAEGKVFVAADYSQIELRAIAQITKDPNMLRVFREGKDPHRATAAIVSGVPEDKVTSSQRQQAKCFHPETEVLTRTGWKCVDALVQGEEILQAIPDNQLGVTLEWVVPSDIFRRKNNFDHLLHLHNEGIDIKVTPDHRMLGFRKEGKFEVTTPEKLGKFRYWANAGMLRGEEGVEVDERLLRLAVAVQGDGSYEGPGIRFGFTKVRKAERLKTLLREGEYNYSERPVNGKKGYYFYIPVGNFVDKLKALLDHDKTLPWSWLGLSDSCREAVLNEFPFWDSHKASTWRMYTYFSSIKKNLDVVQALATISSRKTRLVLWRDEGGSKTRKDGYGLSVKTKPLTRGGNLEVTKIPYTGDVVCLSVPSSFIVTRSAKGPQIPVIIGNCVNFGLIYGMGPKKLVLYAMSNYGVKLTDKEAVTFWRRYFEGYSEIKRWHETAVSNGQRDGYVRTLGGRIRFLPPTSYNEFLNTGAQGLAADGLKGALRKVYDKIKYLGDSAKIVHHVHDEIITEVDNDPELINIVEKLLQEGMIEAMERYIDAIPVEVDPSHGPSWAETK